MTTRLLQKNGRLVFSHRTYAKGRHTHRTEHALRRCSEAEARREAKAANETPCDHAVNSDCPHYT